MAVNDRQGKDLKPYDLEHIANQGFDQEFQVPVVELLGYNADDNTVEKIVTSDGAIQVDTSSQNSSTCTLTSVNDTTSSTTLLASNVNRKGATIFNDSISDLYIKLGATASTTSFTYKLSVGDALEVPYGYTGIIDGIWSSDSTGAARITEFT